MIRVEREIEVERSASEVFDRLVRIEELPRWQPGISEATLETPPPLQAGSRIRLVADVAGQRVVANGTVTSLDRPSRIAITATAGSTGVEGVVTISPIGAERSRVGIVTAIKLGGMLRFVEGVARSRIEAEAPAVAASVKAWLEADEPLAVGGADAGETNPRYAVGMNERVVPGFLPSTHGFHFANAWPPGRPSGSGRSTRGSSGSATRPTASAAGWSTRSATCSWPASDRRPTGAVRERLAALQLDRPPPGRVARLADRCRSASGCGRRWADRSAATGPA